MSFPAGRPFLATARMCGVSLCALSLAGFASAAGASEAGKDLEISTNLTLVSQYIFRGISYTREKPALQGGVTATHASGLYFGFAGTNVSDVAINNASLEIDLFAGYSGTVGDLSYDVGLLQFLFPGGKYNVSREKYSTLELYGGVAWKNLSLKYSHGLTDYFGFNSKSVAQDFGLAPNGNSRGSHYLEAAISFELPYGFNLEAHIGRQVVRHYRDFDFTDHSLTLSKDFGQGWSASVAYVDTNARSSLYTDARGLDTSRAKWLASISRDF